jgi:hypothetical protein
MKYVGQAMSEIEQGMGSVGHSTGGADGGEGGEGGGSTRQRRTIPTIGIATFGVLEEAEALVEGGAVCPPEKPGSKPRLDANHSLFLLVDDGTKGKFGREIAFRSKFEESICRRRFKGSSSGGQLFSDDAEIFSVCLVVEGGIGTIATVMAAVESHTPVLAVEGSGRAADALAYAWRLMHDGQARRNYTIAGLQQQARTLIPKRGSPAEQDVAIEDTVRQLLEVVTTNDYVTVFSAEEYESEGRMMDSALLDAIIKSLRVHPINKSTKLDGYRNLLLMEAGDPRTAGMYEMPLSKPIYTAPLTMNSATPR